MVSATYYKWSAAWGDFHYGGGSNSYVCEGTQWSCGGVRIVFDQPVRLRGFYSPNAGAPATGIYDWRTGATSGFHLWQDATAGAWWQPATLTASSDPYVVVLNTTWIGPASSTPTIVRYAWQDYPLAMPLENAFGLPVGPFNVTLVMNVG